MDEDLQPFATAAHSEKGTGVLQWGHRALNALVLRLASFAIVLLIALPLFLSILLVGVAAAFWLLAYPLIAIGYTIESYLPGHVMLSVLVSSIVVFGGAALLLGRSISPLQESWVQLATKLLDVTLKVADSLSKEGDRIWNGEAYKPQEIVVISRDAKVPEARGSGDTSVTAGAQAE